MNVMKKYFLFLMGVIAIGLLGSVYTNSAPRGKIFVDKISINNGDTRLPFNISITSTSWTQVLPKRAKRRYAVIQTTSTAMAGYICLSTTTTSGVLCKDDTKGMVIGQSLSILENHSEAILYGRLQDGVGGTVYLRGEEEYDSGD